MARTLWDVIAEIERDLKPALKNTSEHQGFSGALSEIIARMGADHPVLEAGDVFVGGDAQVTLKCPDCGELETVMLKQGADGFEVTIQPIGEVADDQEEPGAPEPEADPAHPERLSGVPRPSGPGDEEGDEN